MKLVSAGSAGASVVTARGDSSVLFYQSHEMSLSYILSFLAIVLY